MSDYDTDYFYDYGFLDFQDYSNETRDRLFWVLGATRTAVRAKEVPEFVISLIGIFLNIFHLIILTQKSMRSTSINVLMIGIAISDLYIMWFGTYEKTVRYMSAAPNGYWQLIFDMCADTMKDAFRRVSAWSGVLMAFIRFLIIKNPLNPKYTILSRPSFGWKVILILLISSLLFSAFYLVQFQTEEAPPWTPPEQCTGFPENYTEKQYAFSVISKDLQALVLFLHVYMFTEGMLKIIPAIVLPILAFLLVRELKTAENSRRKMTIAQNTQAHQKDHTTNLVILMTVSFMIAELPLGMAFVATGYFATDQGLGAICTNLTILLTIFVALNATTHCLICMTMSSQYRNCVKSLFCKPKTMIAASRTSVSSVTSLRNVVVTV